MSAWHIAQYNIARLLRPLEDVANADFVANLERINGLGDATPGFVWRHKNADGNSTDVRVRGDDMMIINFTVWDSIDALWEYTYHSAHVEVFRRRRDWFEHLDYPYLVLWWIPAGHVPSVAEADERLDDLIANGPTERAFTFKQRFPAPS